jgi:hypothetical protein
MRANNSLPRERGRAGVGASLEVTAGAAPEHYRGCTVSLPIAVRPVVSGSYMSSTTSAG